MVAPQLITPSTISPDSISGCYSMLSPMIGPDRLLVFAMVD